MTNVTDGLTEGDLLAELPQSVADAVKQLESGGADWNAVGALLAATPTSGIALKGGKWKADLWEAAKREFQSFLCTEAASYADLRSEWKGLKEKGSALVVGSLSGAVGAKLGMASGIVTPLVVWLLVVATRIGHASLCAALAASHAPPAAPPQEGGAPTA